MALTKALDDIWATTLPIAEKRRSARHATHVAVSGEAPQCDVAQSSALDSFEEILQAVALRAGWTRKPGVAKAKAWLIKQGAHDLAIRIGRISKPRNVSAHPDTAACLLAVRELVLPSDARQGSDHDFTAQTFTDEDMECADSGSTDPDGSDISSAKGSSYISRDASANINAGSSIAGPVKPRARTDSTHVPADDDDASSVDSPDICYEEKSANTCACYAGAVSSAYLEDSDEQQEQQHHTQAPAQHKAATAGHVQQIVARLEQKRQQS